jgi:molecular chaperone GrpE
MNAVDPRTPRDPDEDERFDVAADDADGVDVDPGTSEREQALQAQVEALEDRVKRLQADFLNETKRIARQAETERQYAIQRVIVDLLPVIDALHSARSGLGEGKEARAMVEGLDLVQRQLEDALSRHGVEPIAATGLAFDPTKHEALMVVDRPDLPAQTVADVLRPGFTLHGRVVRPAHVSVSRGRSGGEQDDAARTSERPHGSHADADL